MNERKSLWQKFRLWQRETHQHYISICSNRNSIVNVLLSLLLSLTIIISLFVLVGAVCFWWIDPYRIGWAIGIAWIYYPLFCIYYMCRFLGDHHKEAILPAFMGSSLVWSMIILIGLFAMCEEIFFYDEEVVSIWSDLYILILPLIISLLLNTILFGLIYAIMKIKKNGVSAWSQLKKSDDKKTRNMKISIIIFFILLIIFAFAYGIMTCKHLDIF